MCCPTQACAIKALGCWTGIHTSHMMFCFLLYSCSRVGVQVISVKCTPCLMMSKNIVGSVLCSLGLDATASLAGSQYTSHHLVCDVIHLGPVNMAVALSWQVTLTNLDSLLQAVPAALLGVCLHVRSGILDQPVPHVRDQPSICSCSVHKAEHRHGSQPSLTTAARSANHTGTR